MCATHTHTFNFISLFYVIFAILFCYCFYKKKRKIIIISLTAQKCSFCGNIVHHLTPARLKRKPDSGGAMAHKRAHQFLSFCFYFLLSFLCGARAKFLCWTTLCQALHSLSLQQPSTKKKLVLRKSLERVCEGGRGGGRRQEAMAGERRTSSRARGERVSFREFAYI